MRIGIDVDGVLTDNERFQIEKGTEYFQKHHNRDIENLNGFDIKEIFNCSENEYREFWKKHLLEYILCEPVRPGAKSVLRELRKKGHEIYIITKRVFTDKQTFIGWLMRTILKCWLLLHGIRYDDIFFCPEHSDKSEICAENRIDIMIEDNEENVFALCPSIPVLCFDAGYNSKCLGPNIYRVHSFTEIAYMVNTICI